MALERWCAEALVRESAGRKGKLGLGKVEVLVASLSGRATVIR